MRSSTAWVLAASLAACGSPPGPEAAVREWLENATEAAEARDRERLVEMISESYVDARGNDREDVDRLLALWFLRNPEVVLVSHVDEVEMLAGTAARVSLTAGLAGSDSGLAGLEADAYRLELELEARKGGWRLIGARWGELGGELR